jgi:mono/diheme cytochrome c family protein
LEKAKKQKLLISVFTAGNYRNGKFDRVKGPAFVQMPTSEPLSSEQIATWATSQYATPAKSYSGTVDGWQLYAERVFGTEDRCITCHGGIAPAPGDSYVAPKRGDSLGLFVIAVRNR